MQKKSQLLQTKTTANLEETDQVLTITLDNSICKVEKKTKS
jgi:hypothetical protein